MPVISGIPPLPFGMPIVDPATGAASREFSQWWQQFIGNAATINTGVDANTAAIVGKADKTTQIIAGTGLTGGGTLAADRTLAIDTTTEAERIRDVIGAALVAGSNITITINDAGDTITIAAIGGGGAASGTSFPGSPSTGDLFYRSDRHIQYFYDGTRWLSTDKFTLKVSSYTNLAPGYTASASFIDRAVNPHYGEYDIYIEGAVFQYFLSATGNWTLNFIDQSGAVISSTTVSTSGSNTAVRNSSINSVQSNSTQMLYGLSITKNSGSAAIYPSLSFTYRLIG